MSSMRRIVDVILIVLALAIASCNSNPGTTGGENTNKSPNTTGTNYPFIVTINSPTNNSYLPIAFSVIGSTYNAVGIKYSWLCYSLSNTNNTMLMTMSNEGYPLTVIRGDMVIPQTGVYKIWIQSLDIRNRLTKSKPVYVTLYQYVDNKSPTISIASPANNAKVGNVFTVSGNSFDDGSGVKAVWVKIGSDSYVKAAMSGTLWTYNATLASAGVFSVSAYSVDWSGNCSATNAISVEREAGMPSIVLNTPANGTIQRTMTVDAGGTATKDVTAIDQVAVSVNGAAYQAATYTPDNWTKSGLTLSEGTNTIIARAIASSKTNFSSGVKVIVDSQAPSVAISSPADGYQTTIKSVTIDGTASETGVGLEGIYLSTGGDYVKIGSSASWSFTASLPANTYNISVYAKDKAGNQSATKTISITINDEPAPNGLRVHLKKPTSWSKAYIHYWATTPGALASTWPGKLMISEGGDWYFFVITNQTSANIVFNNNGSPQSADLTRNKEGWYKDGAWYDQNPDDTIPPAVAMTNLPATVDNKITLSATASDNIGIAKIEFYRDGVKIGTTNIPSSGSIYTIKWDSRYSPNGSHSMTAKAYDAMNVTESAGVTIITANTNLKPVANAGADFSGIKGNPIQFNGANSADPNGTIVSYSWSDGSGHTLSGATPSYTYSSPGTFNWTLTVVDNEGSSANDAVQVTISTQSPKGDFREESIYFLITTRFYDGDSANNVFTGDDEHAGNYPNDPSWRGDFKGLIQKLPYLKALGFTAIWITPVIENKSGYDYHGYHGYNFNRVDPRYESAGADYQALINAAHALGIKVVQDIVLNHSGNWGAVGLYEPTNDYTKTGALQYEMRWKQIQNNPLYHKGWCGNWEGYVVQSCSIAGDCQDFNTENAVTRQYLIDAYNRYIDMGVDAFRIDTVKHISRYIFNKYFNPAFKARGGPNFFMFGEVCTRYRQVWNNNMPCISAPFYTWLGNNSGKDVDLYAGMDDVTAAQRNFDDNISPDNQRSSGNHWLNGVSYHAPDTTWRSGLEVIDFCMHWNFQDAGTAFGVKGSDSTYNDATWNVVYVDSHDYAPDSPDSTKRFVPGQGTWAENLSMMFTFRGIPCLFYGSEIEFKKGAPIDVGPNAPLENTGRAYFGSHLEGTVNVSDFAEYSSATGEMANTLNYPLAKHIRALNWLRRHVPALQKGQYTTDGTYVSGGISYIRRFTEGSVDSLACVTVSSGATFKNLPGGTYTDLVTGDTKTIGDGGSFSASCSGQGNLRVYVRNYSGPKLHDRISDPGPYLQ